MATNFNQKKLKKEENKTYTARDFESLRAQLLDTARTYFPDKIQDFSEPSVGGMFLDFVATVGDSLNFYLDHAFKELDPLRAVENDNILTHLRNAGVDIVGQSPASVTLRFTVTAPAEYVAAKRSYLPKRSSLPVIQAGTTAASFNGVTFATIDDLDFAAQDDNNDFIANFTVSATDTNGVPTTFKVSRDVSAVSGVEKTELLTINENFVPFREITLAEKSITTILSITDSESNEYYEVSSLSDDTVFLKTKNLASDASQAPNFMQVVSAPYRFIRRYDPSTQLTTIRFGSGNAATLDDDIVPDPSELSLKLFGKKTVDRFNIDPQSLLETQTLGISPRGTTLTIRYRHGGGLDHNVASNSITEIENLSIAFRRNPDAADALSVRQSILVNNLYPASGGDSAPTIQELQTRITGARKAQRRVVSREDLLARVYTLPSEFGRVFRAAIYDNPVNSGSALLYILSRDADGSLTVCPDTLKRNISTYLNELRLVGDAMDILDARVINFGVKYSVLVANNANKTQVVTTINNAIAASLDRRFINIGQPIIIDDITNIIINTDFVISLQELRVFPLVGNVEGRSYSTSTFDFEQTRTTGIITPDIGSIFELRFADFDIIGSAT